VPGAFIDDGTVDIRGCKGVRITAGPLTIPVVSPATAQESTDGVDILVSEKQSISIQRGLIPFEDQTISMTPNTIVINAGLTGSLILRAGLSQITIDPTGITIVGIPMVQINPGPPAPPPPPLPPDVPLPPGQALA